MTMTMECRNVLCILSLWALSVMPLCMSAGFDENCDDSANLCTADLVCSSTTNKCECASGYNYIQDRCLETPYGGSCQQDEDCPAGAQCLDERGERTGTLACVAAALALQSVSVVQYLDDAFKVNLNVTWVPGLYTGPTNFEVSAMGRDYFSQNYNFGAVTITAQDATNAVITSNIYGGWVYRVSVTAKTVVGSGPKYLLPDIITINSRPGMVENVAVMQNSFFANQMALTFECPDATERNGNITAFIVRQTITTGGGAVSTDHTIPHNFVAEDCSLSINASQVGGIDVLNNYTFEVKVKNEDYEGNFTSPVELFTNERKPYTSTSGLLEDLLSPYEESDSDSDERSDSFKVQLCSSCFTDPVQGPIKSVAMVICVKSATETCEMSFIQPNTGSSFTKTIDSPEDINMYDTWATAKANNFTMPYRTTPDGWVERLRRDNSKSFVYTVGADSNCEESQTTIFCNGPLPQNRKFVVTVVNCNDAACDETTSLNEDFNTEVDDDDDDDNDDDVILGLAIALGVIGFICLCLIIFLVASRCRSDSMVV